MARAKYLPSANEFTPNGIQLGFCLKAVRDIGTTKDIRESIRKQYFSEHASARTDPQERLVQQSKLAGNVLIGLKNYQLASTEGDRTRLTEIGEKLLADPKSEKEIFAKHLLENLCGEEVLLAMDSLAKRNISRRHKSGLAKTLSELGVTAKQGNTIPENTTDHTKFATWLKWCGILDAKDEVDEGMYVSIMGRSSGLVRKLWQLSAPQFLFLHHVWTTYVFTGETTQSVRKILKESQEKCGSYVERPDQIAADILRPLEKTGFIVCQRTSDGRGGNSGEITVTQQTENLNETDFFERNERYSKYPRVEKSIDQIFTELDAEDTHIKGIALEELAIKLGALLNLRFVYYRERSVDTGGAEVDVIFDHVGVSYTKWLVQCKNTPNSMVHVSTVAKEVGNATLAHANVLLVITTGKYSQPAREFASKAIEKSNLQVLLLDGSDLEKYREMGGASLVRRVVEINEDISRVRRGLL